MESEKQELGAFLVEQERRLEAISDLIPYAQRLLFDWRYDLTADDGTRVGCFVKRVDARDAHGLRGRTALLPR